MSGDEWENVAAVVDPDMRSLSHSSEEEAAWDGVAATPIAESHTDAFEDLFGDDDEHAYGTEDEGWDSIAAVGPPRVQSPDRHIENVDEPVVRGRRGLTRGQFRREVAAPQASTELAIVSDLQCLDHFLEEPRPVDTVQTAISRPQALRIRGGRQLGSADPLDSVVYDAGMGCRDMTLAAELQVRVPTVMGLIGRPEKRSAHSSLQYVCT